MNRRASAPVASWFTVSTSDSGSSTASSRSTVRRCRRHSPANSAPNPATSSSCDCSGPRRFRSSRCLGVKRRSAGPSAQRYPRCSRASGWASSHCDRNRRSCVPSSSHCDGSSATSASRNASTPFCLPDRRIRPLRLAPEAH